MFHAPTHLVLCPTSSCTVCLLRWRSRHTCSAPSAVNVLGVPPASSRVRRPRDYPSACVTARAWWAACVWSSLPLIVCGPLCCDCVPAFFAPKFHECFYTRRVYCTDCHSGTTRVIPARVLWHWDLEPAPVCDRAAEFLDRACVEPVINVSAVNAELYASMPGATDLTAASLTLSPSPLFSFLFVLLHVYAAVWNVGVRAQV